MKVLHEITQNKNLAIALGYFDGIHIGHKKIITTLVKEAKQMGIESAVITFDKNPADYFKSTITPNIQTFKDRELILSSLGIDYLYELNFEKYKDLGAKEYLEDILVENFKPKLIIVGYNHTFGKNKLGTPSLIQEMSGELGYKSIIIPEQKYKDIEEISSTIIRKRIELGHLNAIKALLGRYFSIRNSVIKGDGIAKTFGVPTANLVWPNSMAKLPYGVYYGFAQTGDKMKPALISWGTKPTLKDENIEVLEVHLHDFNEDLYGKIIKVIFTRKIRDQQNFNNINILKEQIKKDYVDFEKWVESSSQ